MPTICDSTRLLEIIVGVLTIAIHNNLQIGEYVYFLFSRTTLQFFVTYLTDALYMHPLWFYNHQNDNRGPAKLFVTCQLWWFQWRFWFVSSILEYTRILSLEFLHTTFERNFQIVFVSRIRCGVTAGQLYPDNHFD